LVVPPPLPSPDRPRCDFRNPYHRGEGANLVGLSSPPLAGAQLHAGELLHSFSFSLFARTSFASRCWSSSAPPTTVPCPGAAWQPCSNTAVRHAHRRACSGEPPGQAMAPVGAARSPKHTRAADGLTAGENRVGGASACFGVPDQWGQEAHYLPPGAILGALCWARIAISAAGF
jgi:hypothetical protein